MVTLSLKRLEKALRNTGLAFSRVGTYEHRQLLEQERFKSNLLRYGYPEDDIDFLMVLLQRCYTGHVAPVSYWYELVIGWLVHGVMPVDLHGALIFMMSEHVKYIRFPSDSFKEWEDYLFRTGLIEHPRGRWEYQKAVLGSPWRWLKGKFG